MVREQFRDVYYPPLNKTDDGLTDEQRRERARMGRRRGKPTVRKGGRRGQLPDGR